MTRFLFKNLPWNSQVRIRRVAAVISGYLDYNLKESDPFEIISLVFSNFGNRKVLSESNIDVSDLEQLKKKLCEVSDESWRMEHLLKQFQLNEDREQLLNVLLRYRIATEESWKTLSLASWRHVQEHTLVQRLFNGFTIPNTKSVTEGWMI